MHRETYNRGYLPHRDYEGSILAVTFHLKDSLPSGVVEGWKAQLGENLEADDLEVREATYQALRSRIAAYEDAGHGACFLKNPAAARALQELIIGGHPDRYRLIEWCIMPNHVHVLLKLSSELTLAAIVRSWKGSSAVKINRLVGRSGALWQREYFDRGIRDESHYYRSAQYIRNNPVKARLCELPEDWEFSSAGTGWNDDAC